jgi:hypothetical protein
MHQHQQHDADAAIGNDMHKALAATATARCAGSALVNVNLAYYAAITIATLFGAVHAAVVLAESPSYISPACDGVTTRTFAMQGSLSVSMTATDFSESNSDSVAARCALWLRTSVTVQSASQSTDTGSTTTRTDTICTTLLCAAAWRGIILDRNPKRTANQGLRGNVPTVLVGYNGGVRMAGH